LINDWKVLCTGADIGLGILRGWNSFQNLDVMIAMAWS